MKYFLATSAIVTTVRKIGHYPSTRVAAFLSKRFAFTMGYEEGSPHQRHIAAMLRGDSHGHQFCQKHLTTMEFEALFRFGCWWAVERLEECNSWSVDTDQRLFLFLNLNLGRQLCILAK